MQVIIEGSPKEIAALVLELQERHCNYVESHLENITLMSGKKQENGSYTI